MNTQNEASASDGNEGFARVSDEERYAAVSADEAQNVETSGRCTNVPNEDTVARFLVAAVQDWWGFRDPRRLRRMLLKLVAQLD